jgi:hypothetical protein
VASAWGWVDAADIEVALAMIDRELAMIWALTR